MNFPIPKVSEEDKGLLRNVRAKRKYEKKKPNKYGSKKDDGQNNCCMIAVTTIGGLFVIIVTVFLTAKEILNNNHTTITAYPMNYNNNEENGATEGSNNDILDFLNKNENYMYPRISLEEVRREIEKSKAAQNAEKQKETEAGLKAQLSIIPKDFPSDSDPNTMTDIISTLFKDTEFYKRFRTEGDTEWTLRLSKSKAIYNESKYDELPICIQQSNQHNGYGYRIWRDGQVL